MANLAIKGGSKLYTKQFTKWPVHGARENELLMKVLESGKWWRFAYGEGVELKEKTIGPDSAQVTQFQEEFAAYQQSEYCVLCANGTGALEIALKALKIGPGDEVIVPSYTYVGSATCALQVNAVPVFADIDPDTYNLDPIKAEALINERSRAIMPVHFSGQSCDMDAFLKLGKKYNLAIVEDAAHAHGSEWNGHKVGALGDIGTFSFQASKNMTAGEGGAILTNNKQLAKLVDSFIWSGREVDRPWYEFHRLGWNYRITEFQAAILRAQLERLDEQIERRNDNYAYFENKIKEIEGFTPLKLLPGATRHSRHIIMVKYNPGIFGISRELLMDALIAEGISIFKGYIFPLYKNPMFLNQEFYPKGCPINCHHYNKKINYADFEATNPVAEKACKDEALWFDQSMFLGTHEDMNDIISAINKIKDNITELK